MLGRLMLAIAATLFSASAYAEQYDQAVPDQALDQMRGGFTLPNGLGVTLGVVTETRLDGSTVLKTVLTADQGPASIATYTRDAAGNLVQTDAAGGSVIGRDGALSQSSSNGGVRVTLNGQGTDVTHLLRNGLGSIISNTADNRTIDVTTTVDIDISNASPELLGSSLFRVEDVALDATRGLVH